MEGRGAKEISMKTIREFADTKSVRKDFSWKGKVFSEKVARYPKVLYQGQIELKSPTARFSIYPEGKKSIFSLRIDVDEVENEHQFLEYIDVLGQYAECVTLFCSASAFKGKEHLIERAVQSGLDIQSHGYYHYTHNDYDNLYKNISRAKDFFDDIGVKTEGFAAPMGKYNDNLTMALEVLGYRYSSDFSFDYLNFPHYPLVKKRVAKVLQLPIFPVCPELMFSSGSTEDEVFSYFVNAVGSIMESGLPVIVYAHTNKFCDKVIRFLDRILKRAREYDDLYRCTSTDFAGWCFDIEDKEFSSKLGILNPALIRGEISLPNRTFFGVKTKRGFKNILKEKAREIIDYEDIVPLEELEGSRPMLLTKKFVRQLRKKKNKHSESGVSI